MGSRLAALVAGLAAAAVLAAACSGGGAPSAGGADAGSPSSTPAQRSPLGEETARPAAGATPATSGETEAQQSSPGGEPAPAATATAPATAGAQQPSPGEGYVEPDRELTGLTGWINHEPLTIGGLLAQGRVVLVDFWTYTCVNCIRTLPFLRQWHEKYADHGLTILGIHSPEFDFERQRANVIDAVERRGIEYPVAQDNEMATWRAFENRAWPAKYLFGVDGELRYQLYGEGLYRQTELAIRRALEQAGWDVDDIPIGDTENPLRDPNATSITRELYGGYRWNFSSLGPYAGQEPYYEGGDREVLYEDDEDATPHLDNRWYLQGLWLNEREAITHARRTTDLEDYIALRFRATSVNVVLRPARDEPFEVVVEIEGRPLDAAQAGADVTFDEAGRSVVLVDGPRLYAIVQLPAFGEHELRLRSNSDDFSVFAFTFGAYAEGP